jgi:hypothetical protein
VSTNAIQFPDLKTTSISGDFAWFFKVIGWSSFFYEA